MIRWADRQDLGTMLFILNDVTEQREWESVHTRVDRVAQVLTTMLGMLNNDVASVG